MMKQMTNVPPYSRMARYYDAIYFHIVDYNSEFNRVLSVIKKHFEGEPELVLDLACGTGNYTFLFAKFGYKATGIDISSEMIRIAKEKRPNRNSGNPRFFIMDMAQIENLPDKYDVACVLFGGFGYLLSDRKVKKFLEGVLKHLTKNGLLIYEFWQSSAVFPSAKTSAGSKSWEKIGVDRKQIVRLNMSKYNSRRSVLKIIFDFFVMDSRKGKLLDRFSETHLLRTYTIRSMQKILKARGFHSLGFYDGDSWQKFTTLKPPASSTFRVLAVARAQAGT